MYVGKKKFKLTNVQSMILFFIEKTRYFLFYTSVPKRFPFSYAMPRRHSRGSTRRAYVESPKLESQGAALPRHS